MQEVPEHPVSRESAQEACVPLSRAMINEVLVSVGEEPVEDPRITENREIVENLIDTWRLQAAIDIERARSVI